MRRTARTVPPTGCCCAQISTDCSTLALALDGAGFPRSCEILPGNVSDVEAVCGGTAPKPTVVMDAGIATEENIVWLGAQTRPGPSFRCVSQRLRDEFDERPRY